MQTKPRPLSPHIQIYRWQWTSVLSILHRASGLLLAVGLVALVYWLGALAGDPQGFAQADWLIGSWIGLIVLFAFTAALFYHLCNGIRHLCWDAGKGFELTTARASGRAVVVVASVLTILVWVIAWLAR